MSESQRTTLTRRRALSTSLATLLAAGAVSALPTPASAHATAGPTLKARDWTATPSSPVIESRATMEYVCTGREGISARAGSSWTAPIRATTARSIFFMSNTSDDKKGYTPPNG